MDGFDAEKGLFRLSERNVKKYGLYFYTINLMEGMVLSLLKRKFINNIDF